MYTPTLIYIYMPTTIYTCTCTCNYSYYFHILRKQNYSQDMNF